MNDDKEDGDIINERNNRRKPNFIDKIINKSLNRTTLFEIKASLKSIKTLSSEDFAEI